MTDTAKCDIMLNEFRVLEKFMKEKRQEILEELKAMEEPEVEKWIEDNNLQYVDRPIGFTTK